jgi:hypothetical protein
MPMKPTSPKDFAELVAFIGIIVSLVFVGLQLRQSEVIALSELNASVLANRIEVNAAIIEHPDIWERGNRDEELVSADAAIFSRQVLNINDEAYYSVQQFLIWGDVDGADLDTAVFAAYLHENPGARRVWRSRADKLRYYRGLIIPDEQVTSDWIESVESKLAVYERTKR